MRCSSARRYDVEHGVRGSSTLAVATATRKRRQESLKDYALVDC
jgi:hypothetical protein